MVEQLSLTFDAPPDGAAVSCEQTQVRLEEFRQMPWLEPEWGEATQNVLQVVERFWHRRVHFGDNLLDIPIASLAWLPIWLAKGVSEGALYPFDRAEPGAEQQPRLRG
jgi:hypothetical protein